MDLIAGLSPQAWTGAAVGVVAFVGAVTAAIINAFGGVQKQVNAAKSQLTEDLERQVTGLRSELMDAERRCKADAARQVAEQEAKCDAQIAAVAEEWSERHELEMKRLRAELSRATRRAK